MTPAYGADAVVKTLPSFKPLPMKVPVVHAERRADRVQGLFTAPPADAVMSV
jgi:hypothetical protein